jgi:2-iminobutanoate/2-iminopropanoate deaminase
VKKLLILIIAVSLHACADEERNRTVFSPHAPKPVGPYSQGVLKGGTLFVSGQIGMRGDGTLDSTNIAAETKQALSNIKAIVEESGMKMSDVSKCSIFLTDIRNFAAVNEVYATFFPADPPARETVEVRALPKGAHIEISAIAKR